MPAGPIPCRVGTLLSFRIGGEAIEGDEHQLLALGGRRLFLRSEVPRGIETQRLNQSRLGLILAMDKITRNEQTNKNGKHTKFVALATQRRTTGHRSSRAQRAT